MQIKPFFMLMTAVVVSLLSACSGDPGTGPIEVRWDRDICERCRMILSDRYYAAQIRYFPEGKKRSKVSMFDDIGCATLWLEEKPWKDDPGIEIWVTDHQTGAWIDARKATYIKGKITPMVFGLGAQVSPAEGGLDFTQAKKHIVKVEERFGIHGVHLMERLKEQAEKRELERKDRQSQK